METEVKIELLRAEFQKSQARLEAQVHLLVRLVWGLVAGVLLILFQARFLESSLDFGRQKAISKLLSLSAVVQLHRGPASRERFFLKDWRFKRRGKRLEAAEGAL